MANWASTDYAIEGPTEVLNKIYEALENHPTQKDSSEDWEGNVLKALGISYEPHNIEHDENSVKISGYYMRGFIHDFYWSNDEKTALRIYAEEAWGLTDFSVVLKNHFPDIKVFYIVEEPGEGIYVTNDKDGKYFRERYYVDVCIDGDYQSEYFSFKSDAFKWLWEITDGRVNSMDKIEEFNADYEDSEAGDENFIYFHEFKIVE